MGLYSDREKHYTVSDIELEKELNKPGSFKNLALNNTGFEDSKRTCVYYSNWSIYNDRQHFPKDIPLQLVTNVFYCFMNINPKTGEVSLSDEESDVEIALDSINNDGSKVSGIIGQFQEMKSKKRSFKLSMSIGGQSNHGQFTKAMKSNKKLERFVDSSINLLVEHGFDGIDLDWEYPETVFEGNQYLRLVKRLRKRLDDLEDEKGLERGSLLVTMASPGTEEFSSKLFIEEFDKYLSFWNLMTYDFAGEWSEKAGYHCNLYPTEGGEYSGDQTVQYYLSKGVRPEKLTLGMANYGRGFLKTKGLNQPFHGVGAGSTDEEGIWNYNFLPLEGTEEEYDEDAVSAYIYDSDKKFFIGYDNPESVQAKAEYVVANKLGGGMWWESCGDTYDDKERSLLYTFVEAIGGEDMLDSVSENWVNFKE
ncbi:putative chitinase [Ascoidea rubescens DSM 1968]|uniref:chitinase n=1 Tax=Ascoidea rubescens DSM 1968 TaxID=1344418 RepID=A0A1D2VKX5_9ASCO|nr:glycoside hydrolase family 18 protein [Ascoidea rubescens DSM 1968]ODV62238.1 glycoside hydrolase family 18 protein [Ascoidea rubescens DSM 1968]